MGDPIERIRLFVEDQQQQACSASARLAWRRKFPQLLPAVEEVVQVMRRGLLPDQFQNDTVSVLSDVRRDQFPLVIAFGPRATTGAAEIGASAVFRCESD